MTHYPRLTTHPHYPRLTTHDSLPTTHYPPSLVNLTFISSFGVMTVKVPISLIGCLRILIEHKKLLNKFFTFFDLVQYFLRYLALNMTIFAVLQKISVVLGGLGLRNLICKHAVFPTKYIHFVWLKALRFFGIMTERCIVYHWNNTASTTKGISLYRIPNIVVIQNILRKTDEWNGRV